MKYDVKDIIKFKVLMEDLDQCAKLAKSLGFNSIASILLVILAALSIKDPSRTLALLRDLSESGVNISKKYISIQDYRG